MSMPQLCIILWCVPLLYTLSIISCTNVTSQGNSNPQNSLSFENEMLIEINRARTNPAEYALYLEDVKKYYDNKLPKIMLEDEKKADSPMSAYYAAIAFLKTAKPLPALTPSQGLSSAARDHLRDQMQAEHIGHIGSDGSNASERMERYGAWEVGIGEDIVYGSPTAQRLAMQLVIDLEAPGHTYRRNIFNPDFSVLGIACGSNARYTHMCVVTFAGKYVEHPK
jgi:uncharacterized protein YkwD